MSYIGASPTNTAFVTDQFSGTGSQTAFTMSLAPATTSSIIVAITGALQDPSTYSVSGTTLTFSAAPPSGTGNISVRYLGIPASGVTTTAYRTVTEFTATAGQTSFSVPSYTVGYIDVYRNGARLGSDDFTADDGTTVVLTDACTAGDLVVTESFYVSSVLNAIPATAGAVNSTYLAGSLSLTSPTMSNPTFTGTATGTVLVSGTAQASTSGTSIDFTGIPNWVKRITVMFNNVSISGTDALEVRLGSASGFVTSNYVGAVSSLDSAPVGTAFSSGFRVVNSNTASAVWNGNITITLLSGNVWTMTSTLAYATVLRLSSGSVDVGATLTQLSILPVVSSTFDAGTINIMYE